MINELIQKIVESNRSYRSGNAIISDMEYDNLVDELRLLDPTNDIFDQIGFQIQDETRKSKLPIEMASMNKVKTLDEIKDWIRLKNIPISTQFVITPKYDGLSLCVDEFTNEAWTRGDGEFGQKSDDHYKLIENHLYEDIEGIETMYGMPFRYSFGEVMMIKDVFTNKYAKDFANPRNLVAGLLNSKDISESLKDTVYIKYGAGKLSHNFKLKSDILNELNSGQRIEVPYELKTLSELNEDYLFDLFELWKNKFEIDGLIIEINDINIQEKLGRERSTNNPCWARAFKSPRFEQIGETEILGIDWMISKNGLLKPIARLNPIKLDGVTISNVTCNNARFVKDMGLGKGSIVKIKRSGMVIPLITDVVKTVTFELPTIDGVEIDWNENGVELVTLTETEEQKIKKIISFFEILEAENFGEGVVRQLWDAGFQSVKDIINLKPVDLEKIDRFGKRKSDIVYKSIQKSVQDVSLSKLQHATGIFSMLGSKKLLLLEHFKTKPSLDEVINIDGFAEISAKSYLDGYDKFNDFIKDLPITVKEKIETDKMSNELDGIIFVFTGVRRIDLEKIIESKGGKIGSGVSKTTSYLVMKSIGSGSSKEKKASDFGVKIITVNELEEILKK